MKLADFCHPVLRRAAECAAQLGLKAATRVTGPLVTGDDSGVRQRGLELLAVPSLWYALCAYGLSRSSSGSSACRACR